MLEILIHYRYAAIAVAMVIGGDIVLISAVYLLFHNYFSLWPLIATCFFSTMIADVAWYSLGKYLPKSPLISKKLARKSAVETVQRFFDKHSLKTLFYSKFIYGTRTIVQILCGFKRLPLVPYLAVNSIGTIGYIFLIIIIGYFVRESVEFLHETIAGFRITVLIGLVIIISIAWLNKLRKQRKFQ
jgi:membrane protein DedA with SNARE-associated domain